MHTRNKLNARKVATLTRVGMHGDGGGLYLRIRPSGSRSWVFVRVVNGVRRELGLGPAADVTLAEAREEAASLRRAFRSGRDPVAERKTAREDAKPKLTFGQFAEDCMAEIVKGYRSEKHRNQWFSTIRTYASDLYSKPIDSVDTQDVLSVISPIWLEKPETAGRVRQRLERILSAATVQQYRSGDNPARLHGHLDQILPKQEKRQNHHAALPYKDLSPFMADLRKRAGTAARALEFAILTAARTSETLGMVWAELDLEGKVWTIPAERMKAGESHEVPLSEAVVAILEAVKPQKDDPSQKVFTNGKGTSLSNMAMTLVLRRMGRSDITVHGFRSTFRDWAGEETSYPREVAEMALAHQVGGKTERAYRRGRSLDKRRSMMEAWSKFAGSAAAHENTIHARHGKGWKV